MYLHQDYRTKCNTSNCMCWRESCPRKNFLRFIPFVLFHFFLIHIYLYLSMVRYHGWVETQQITEIFIANFTILQQWFVFLGIPTSSRGHMESPSVRSHRSGQSPPPAPSAQSNVLSSSVPTSSSVPARPRLGVKALPRTNPSYRLAYYIPLEKTLNWFIFGCWKSNQLLMGFGCFFLCCVVD